MADNNQKPTLSWSQPAQPKPVVNTHNTNTAPVAPVTTGTSPVPPVKSNTAPIAAATTNTGTYVGIFVAGLIIGALIGWGITSSNSGSTSTMATSTAMTATSTSQATGSNVNLNGSTIGAGTNGSITLASTEPAGFAVNISSMSVSQPTWVVVYQDNNGKAGNALGAGLFFAGQTSGTLQLLRATTAGHSYLVGQAIDNGDKTFSLSDDKQVTDANGTSLYTEFTAK